MSRMGVKELFSRSANSPILTAPCGSARLAPLLDTHLVDNCQSTCQQQMGSESHRRAEDAKQEAWGPGQSPEGPQAPGGVFFPAAVLSSPPELEFVRVEAPSETSGDTPFPKHQNRLQPESAWLCRGVAIPGGPSGTARSPPR